MRVPLKDNVYSTLCFLANHDKREKMYITDVITAKTYFKDFLDESDIKRSIENNVAYILFTKQ